MYAAERHQVIAARARVEGRADVAELARELKVTRETIRRDLTQLEQAGVLRRVHGGAMPIERLTLERGLEAGPVSMAAEKQRIAKAALAELPERGTILLDAGTTTAALADVLPGDRDLVVVTNSLLIAGRLAATPRLTTMLLGGRVRGATLASVDVWALRTLAQVHVDVAFMATNGVTPEFGLTTPDTAEAAVKSAMVDAAERVVLLADHTKVGAAYFARFAELDDVEVILTDTGLNERLARRLEAAGPKVVRT
jgi:DeoR family transcriptional regulator, fructose operon transcriptional repressor